MTAFTPTNRQVGVSLIEVLIALLVMTVGVLGFAGLQMTSINQSTSANHRVTAVLIAQDAIERMELNPAARDTYLSDSWTAGTLGDSPSNTCIAGTCDSEAIATWDIAQLTWQAANQLPAGRIEAAECGFNDMTCVAVSWDNQDPAACVSGGINTDIDSNCFVLEVAR
ncbi:type IV pilus modification protein PilV [Halopseudomonas formosensis]|uniref:Type IV pilus modification protein PilV n=1 Tax=Halopseudomonas formosensis TaxID=1002526 RepID=A0ABU5BZG9_9GAMM|nr:type IV pilus modification protein PilV [Halopseudomonas formosensis]MDX9688174.1 type IV pilus modification protein PilV [Halopseudomonas formosensis]